MKQRVSKKRTLDKEPILDYICPKDLPPPAIINPIFLAWWEEWAPALVERMLYPHERNMSIAEQMQCRLTALPFYEHLKPECADYWFKWTFENACQLTRFTFLRWRWHALWALQQCGVPRDVRRMIVGEKLWDTKAAHARGARMIRNLFYWDCAYEDDAKKLKWLPTI